LIASLDVSVIVLAYYVVLSSFLVYNLFL